MAALQEIFEKDRERFCERVRGADEQIAVREVRAELDRVLLRFASQEEDPLMAQAAGSLLRTASAAAAFTDVQADAVIYGDDSALARERKGRFAGKGDMLLFGILLAAGILSAALTILTLVMPDQLSLIRRLEGVLFALLGALCCFLAGRRLPERGARKSDGKLRVSTRVDADRLCRRLQETLMQADQEIGQLRLTLRAQDEHLRRESADMDPALLELFGDVLESAYAKDDDESRELTARVCFYLHGCGVDVVEPGQAQKGWFDYLPAPEAMTIRPALVREGTVLRKGLAAHG